MKITRALLAACTLGLALAACDSTPAITAPDRALLDGGFGFGSGHRAGSDTTSTTTAASPMGETADDTTTTAERGGFGFGSGH